MENLTPSLGMCKLQSIWVSHKPKCGLLTGKSATVRSQYISGSLYQRCSPWQLHLDLFSQKPALGFPVHAEGNLLAVPCGAACVSDSSGAGSHFNQKPHVTFSAPHKLNSGCFVSVAQKQNASDDLLAMLSDLVCWSSVPEMPEGLLASRTLEKMRRTRRRRRSQMS